MLFIQEKVEKTIKSNNSIASFVKQKAFLWSTTQKGLMLKISGTNVEHDENLSKMLSKISKFTEQRNQLESHDWIIFACVSSKEITRNRICDLAKDNIPQKEPLKEWYFNKIAGAVKQLYPSTSFLITHKNFLISE
jgi:hypothetical protein